MSGNRKILSLEKCPPFPPYNGGAVGFGFPWFPGTPGTPGVLYILYVQTGATGTQPEKCQKRGFVWVPGADRLAERATFSAKVANPTGIFGPRKSTSSRLRIFVCHSKTNPPTLLQTLNIHTVLSLLETIFSRRLSLLETIFQGG